MKEDISTLFCDFPGCSSGAGTNCSFGFSAIINPNSCINQVLIISVDILLLIFFYAFLYREASKKIAVPLRSPNSFPFLVFSAIFNGSLSLVYLGFGVWLIIEKLSTRGTILPFHGWLVMTIQGFTWLQLSLTLSLRKLQPSHPASAKFFSIFAFLIAVFLGISSLWKAFVEKVATVWMVLNILCIPGSILLLFCTFWRAWEVENDAYRALLQDKPSSNENVTPFARAGLFSSMSFCWLNPLMKKGKEKILQDEDIPQLRPEDRAETLYSIFSEQQAFFKIN